MACSCQDWVTRSDCGIGRAAAQGVSSFVGFMAARLLCIEVGRLSGSEAQARPSNMGEAHCLALRCVPYHPRAVQVFSGTVWLPSGNSTERRGLAYHICLPSSPACHWLSIPKSARQALSSCLLMMLIPCWTGRVRMPQQMPINGFRGQSLPIL